VADVGEEEAFVDGDVGESLLAGVDRRKLKFTNLNTLQAEASVRIKSESGREGKQINQEYKADDMVICFTEVRF
jgi:hypothetical protein